MLIRTMNFRQCLRISMLMLGLVLVFSTQGTADEAQGDQDTKSGDQNDSDEEAFAKTLLVPGHIVDQGMWLQLRGELFELKQAEVTLSEPVEDVADAVLLAKDKRVLNFQRANVYRHLLDDLRPRVWRMGLQAGGASIDRNAWEKVFLDGGHTRVGFELAYQPQAIGVTLAVASLSNIHSTVEGVIVHYDATQIDLAVAYEWALGPLRASSLWSRPHVAALLGGSWLASELRMRDEELELKDNSDSMGPFFGVELRMPVSNNFWFNLRWSRHYLKVELDEFHLSTNAPSNHLNFGGIYAF